MTQYVNTTARSIDVGGGSHARPDLIAFVVAGGVGSCVCGLAAIVLLYREWQHVKEHERRNKGSDAALYADNQVPFWFVDADFIRHLRLDAEESDDEAVAAPATAPAASRIAIEQPRSQQWAAMRGVQFGSRASSTATASGTATEPHAPHATGGPGEPQLTSTSDEASGKRAALRERAATRLQARLRGKFVRRGQNFAAATQPAKRTSSAAPAEAMRRVDLARRMLPGGTLPAFQTLKEEFPEHLTVRALNEAVCLTHHEHRDKAYSRYLAVSHRWETAKSPDAAGRQIRAIQKYLRAHPDIEYVWYDYWCLPQRPPEGGQRTPMEQKQFDEGLSHANLLYLGCRVLILLDTSYISRFWHAPSRLQPTTSRLALR